MFSSIAAERRAISLGSMFSGGAGKMELISPFLCLADLGPRAGSLLSPWISASRASWAHTAQWCCKGESFIPASIVGQAPS